MTTRTVVLARAAALPLALAACFPSFSQTLVAQAATASELRETVVTATRVEQPLSDLVADVSIIDSTAIQKSGAVSVADVLSRVPGIQTTSNGGPGANASVLVRGGENRFTAVYIDGVRVDSQTTGGVQWEQIPLSQIDRIEVLRGPAAAVYGSDAVSGVIQLFTKKGEGKPAPYVGVGFGNQGTRTAEAGVSGSAGAFDYSLGVSHERSDGFNARPIPTANPDDDGYKRTSGNARLGWNFAPGQRLQASLLASNLNSQYDDSTGLKSDDRNHHQLRTAALSWDAKWNGNYSTLVQVNQSDAKYSSEPNFYMTETTVRSYLFQNEYRLGIHRFTAALERREDELHNSATQYAPDLKRDRSQNALALGYGLISGAHTLQSNLRRDDDSEFGGKTTGSLSYGYAINSEWRVTAGGGTSFRAPTLYQRFSEYGDASLKPESGRNLEIGTRWTRGSTSAGLVAYRNRVSNLIIYGAPGTCPSSWGCYQAVGRAEYEGVTLSAAHKLGPVSLNGSLDFQNPHDLDTGRQLARRSKRYAKLGADTMIGGWTVGAEVNAASRRYDSGSGNNMLGGYSVFNLYTSTRVGRDFTLLARINNLADKDYQLARNYATAGRTLYVGLKWAPL
ncbi:TonB-dependent receptor domain-containing protein [Diaphorobacter aerolatus]|uniref:TonB-dependent receptor n=1 Tax=Diaphorobacter aerolatus TaxID=1288495 RepID=A0A7H0GJ54_9BURK|nr:TonB-dependent receptor [Diaphorobacter aerolatus]QNP48320.1 TonB-dependent receptor [Diaphorobacter aerolatus]